jgi:hypothetical protein
MITRPVTQPRKFKISKAEARVVENQIHKLKNELLDIAIIIPNLYGNMPRFVEVVEKQKEIRAKVVGLETFMKEVTI